MFFTILGAGVRPPADAPANSAYLRTDYWDDWGKYRTMFTLVVVDDRGLVQEIGSVKIGEVGLKPSRTAAEGERAPSLLPTFDRLDDRFFSVGQGEDYYATLNQLAPTLRQRVLEGLNDCAFNLLIFDAHLDEYVMGESLLRDVRAANVRGRLNRLSRGDAQLTEFRFNYTLPHPADVPTATLTFEVVPESHPPTNVHVLIGRNGVGKTRCMRQLALALLGRQAPEGESYGEIALLDEGWAFAGVILISFSAFDSFDLKGDSDDRLTAHQVGLRHHVEGQGAVAGIADALTLAQDFRQSFERCRVGLKAERWRAALLTLEVDDLFRDLNVAVLLEIEEEERRRIEAEALFRRLSSGHAIVLLTVTRLVELVDEKTLVLLDEPEGHLHPPLLSAFIRCLSDLLVKRNGVAIVATHSPVVLQEVPRSAAWKLRRARAVSVVERPTLETFGESIGLLTRDVFGLEVTRSGFHQMLQAAVDQNLDYDAIVRRFNSQLGAEARSIVRALVAERDEE
ncbi:ATP-binding protein [Rhodanobacter sp. 7MK24]|nr:ATP-binding protein [Rhodanobacter sp. 7MK24]